MKYMTVPKNCPICGREAVFESLRNFILNQNIFSLFECPSCLVQFWFPFENPGAAWYQEEDSHNIKFDKPRCLHSYHKEFLNEHVTIAPGAKTLDLGCGTGEFTETLRKKGAISWGVDFDQVAIQIGKKYFGDENLYAMPFDVFFKKNDLPKFDIITSFEVIEHIDNPLGVLKNAQKLLKPEGKLVISIPSREKPFVNLSSWDFPYHHLSRWNAQAVRNILMLAGFNKITVKYINKFDFLYEFFLEVIASFFGFKKITKMAGVKNKEPNAKNNLKNKIKKYFIKPVYHIARFVGVKVIPYAITILYYPVILIFYRHYGVMYIEGRSK